MKDILKSLFHSLNHSNVDYLILRGYENLPESFSNDLDFSVLDEKELEKFLKVIQKVSDVNGLAIVRDVARVGLLKIKLFGELKEIKIDIFYTFQYAGLIYLNSASLHKTKELSSTGIPIPKKNYELAAALLKEILHNSRIREDKKIGLQQLFLKYGNSAPFLPYFSREKYRDIEKALFHPSILYFPSLSRRARYLLLKKNLKKRGFFESFSSVIFFFYVKYFKQNLKDNLIN